MRDVERIHKFCNELATLWAENFPDWRFGQLIDNFLVDYGHSIFYPEDDEFMEEFRNFIERISGTFENSNED